MSVAEQIEGVAREHIAPFDDLTEWWTGRVSLPLPGGDDIPLVIFTGLEAATTEGRREALRLALAFDPAVRGRVEELLYEGYAVIRDLLDPGAVPDIAASADVWVHARPYELDIPEHEGLRHRYFTVVFRVDWEEEHGAEILFRAGVPIEWADSSGTTSPKMLEAQEEGVRHE